MKWGFDHEEIQKRGPPDWKYDYNFPRGWKGYALNVQSKYENNDKWIKRDGNKDEWVIMYHGTN